MTVLQQEQRDKVGCNRYHLWIIPQLQFVQAKMFLLQHNQLNIEIAFRIVKLLQSIIPYVDLMVSHTTTEQDFNVPDVVEQVSSTQV